VECSSPPQAASGPRRPHAASRHAGTTSDRCSTPHRGAIRAPSQHLGASGAVPSGCRRAWARCHPDGLPCSRWRVAAPTPGSAGVAPRPGGGSEQPRHASFGRDTMSTPVTADRSHRSACRRSSTRGVIALAMPVMPSTIVETITAIAGSANWRSHRITFCSPIHPALAAPADRRSSELGASRAPLLCSRSCPGIADVSLHVLTWPWGLAPSSPLSSDARRARAERRDPSIETSTPDIRRTPQSSCRVVRR
jgi:hypothetical protein